MQYSRPTNRHSSGPSTFLRLLMWLLFIPLLLGIYGDWLLQSYISPMPLWLNNLIAPVLGPPLAILYLLPSLLFYAGPTPFLVLWAVGLFFCAWLWFVSQRGWIARAISLVPLGLLVIAPFAVTKMYAHKPLPSIGMEPGHEMIWLTQPSAYLGVAIRRARYEQDLYHYDDDYKLHGWSKSGKLYYGSFGPSGLRTLWEFDPAISDRPRRIRSLSDCFVPATAINQLSPRHPSSSLRPRLPIGKGVTIWNPLTIEESISPDGLMRAVVINDSSVLHIEVIVLQRVDP